jgi:hypothetical protein
VWRNGAILNSPFGEFDIDGFVYNIYWIVDKHMPVGLGASTRQNYEFMPLEGDTPTFQGLLFNRIIEQISAALHWETLDGMFDEGHITRAHLYEGLRVISYMPYWRYSYFNHTEQTFQNSFTDWLDIYSNSVEDKVSPRVFNHVSPEGPGRDEGTVVDDKSGDSKTDLVKDNKEWKLKKDETISQLKDRAEAENADAMPRTNSKKSKPKKGDEKRNDRPAGNAKSKPGGKGGFDANRKGNGKPGGNRGSKGSRPGGRNRK